MTEGFLPAKFQIALGSQVKIGLNPVPDHVKTNSRSRNEIYDARTKAVLPGKLIMKNLHVEASSEVTNLWLLIESYLNFLREVFELESYDGEGSVIRTTLNYLDEYYNIFFDGSILIAGTSDDIINDPTAIANQLTKGLMLKFSSLDTRGDPASIFNSYCDIFAICFDQWINHQSVDQSDWLIGRYCFQTEDMALRSLANPGTAFTNIDKLGTDPQISNFKDYKPGQDYENSGILNKSFYLFAKKLGGYSWKKAIKIWYSTLREEGAIVFSCTFQEFAQSTINVVSDQYDQETLDILREAWSQVGITV